MLTQCNKLYEERDQLRARVAALEKSLSIMTQLCQIKYGNLDKDVWAEIEKAKSLLQ